jgi:beta-glucosidase
MKFERGLFEQPYLPEETDLTKYDYNRYPQALQLARESVVLLKNENNLLPLNTNHIRSIAVVGPNADEIYNQLGDYTPPIREEEGSTVLQGIKALIKDCKNAVEVKYSSGCSVLQGTEEGIAEAVELSNSCDVTILVLGGSSSRFGKVQFDTNGAAIVQDKITMDCGEGVDSATLTLPEIQRQLAEAIYRTGAKVITTLIQGRPYAIEEIARQSAGVLCCFYLGMKGGQAIAEILFGITSPSGRLPVSIPRHAGQLPVYYNYKSSYSAMNYYDLEKQPLYSFGYGLSYSEFHYQNIRLDKYSSTLSDLCQSGIHLIFEITNVGEFDSYAVPQLYIRDIQASTIRRIRELKDFTKVWVPKGETVQVIFALEKEKLSIWNNEMKFVTEPGDFELFLNDCGEDIWNGIFTLQS